jgi:hypothetical protein
MKKLLLLTTTLVSLSSFADGGRVTFKNLEGKLLPAKAITLAEDTFSVNCNPNATYIAAGDVNIYQKNDKKRFEVALHVYGEADSYSNNEQGFRERYFEVEEVSRNEFRMTSYSCEGGL